MKKTTDCIFNEKRRFIWAVIFILPLFFTFSPKTWINKGSAAENECINCHTNLKKLMDLSWEVKKLKPKQKISKETSGEG